MLTVARNSTEWRGGLVKVAAAGVILTLVAVIVNLMSDRFDDRARESATFFIMLSVSAAVMWTLATLIVRYRNH